ncbi:retrovirus-related pol polyprotein from transposon TNT 1-94 [Tanacetum coccineum]
MKNHQNRPTGSLALPDSNVVNNNDNKNSGSKRGRGNPRRLGRGRGHYGHNRFPNRNHSYHRGGYNGRGRGRGHGRGQRNYTYHAPQVNNLNQKSNEVGTSQNAEGSCFRCGSANHWSKACRTPSHLFKRVRLDNAGEFTSHAFNDYCMSVGIVVEHSNAHIHTQNGLAESLIKRLQLIVRPLLMRTKLPVSMWGHAILHAASLIRMRPSANHKYSLIQLASGQEPNISHLRIFGCAVYVPITPTQRTKMGPQRRLGIYVGYETFSIIRYIEPLTGDLFTTCFADCHFNETVFPRLGGVKKNQEKYVIWCEPSLLYLDPRTKQCETKIQKIMHLQVIANQLPNAFTDTKRVTKSHIPAANAPARVKIPNKQAGNNIAQESQKSLKRGRPIGSKDKNPRKRKGTEKNSDHDENVLNETQDIKTSPEEEINDINKEMLINYSQTHILWDRNKIGDIDEIFSYSIASDIMSGNADPEPKSVIDCKSQPDWDKWEDAMQAELNSLNKRMVFGHIVITPRDVKPIGYRWIFMQKRNEKNEVTRFVIIVVYVDDLNIIGTNKEINEVVMHLKEEFEMKDLVKSLSTPMVGRSLNVDNDPFRPCEEGEDVLGPEVPYLSAIRALMYLTNCTRPDISFAVNLLARFSPSPTKRHWNGIKHIFRYLRGSTDLGLFYSNNSKQGLVGYADAGYLSDPHKARSQTGYVYLNGGTVISWCFQKQTLVATSSNHAEVIALH